MSSWPFKAPNPLPGPKGPGIGEEEMSRAQQLLGQLARGDGALSGQRVRVVAETVTACSHWISDHNAAEEVRARLVALDERTNDSAARSALETAIGVVELSHFSRIARSA